MLTNTLPGSPAVRSYSTLSKALGVVALSLPVVLVVGSILSNLWLRHALPHPLVERSISDYYYSDLRNYYVGSLCAIAVFLVCLRGYDPIDEVAETLAGIAAFGVAMFPPADPHGRCATALETHFGYAHSAFAAIMFVVLAYLCLLRFRRSSPLIRPTRAKRKRNRLYAVCGFTILLNVLAMTGFTAVRLWEGRHPSHWLFWFESLALGAFGVAWLTKGGAFLKDRPRAARRQKATHASSIAHQAEHQETTQV